MQAPWPFDNSSSALFWCVFVLLIGSAIGVAWTLANVPYLAR